MLAPVVNEDGQDIRDCYRFDLLFLSLAAALKSELKNLTPTDGPFVAAFESATLSNRKLARYYLRSMELAAKSEPEPWHIP
jgi:hypothetical protein